MGASLFRWLSVSFWSTLGQDLKVAKYAFLIPGPGMFVNVRNAPRVVIAPPSEIPLFRPVSHCVRFFSEIRVYTAFTRESERGPFVREVEKCDEKWFETAL